MKLYLNVTQSQYIHRYW